MKVKNIVISASLAISFLTTNSALWACSSCNVLFSFSKEKIDAYFNTTILMGILPVSFMCLLVFLVYKTSRSANS
jgi:hypothetical protein